MGILKFLRKYGRDGLGFADKIFDAVRRLSKGAKNLQELRDRLAKGAAEGDLDDVISWAGRHDKRIQDFIEGK